MVRPPDDRALGSRRRAGRLTGKVAFLTGAGGGIGQASARMFAREGAAVTLVDVDQAAAEAVAADIADAGGRCLAVAADVTDPDAMARAAELSATVNGPATILLTCAGGSLAADDLVTDVPLDVWEHTIDLDLKGTLLSCRVILPQMIAAGGGAVVTLSSGAALRGASPKHIYTAAKGAVVSLTRAIAGSHARYGIRANAICAGRVLTARILAAYGHPGGAPGPTPDRQDAADRLKDYPFWVGEPEDIAHVALFLASDEARMITGAAIPADGGRSAY